MKAGRGAAAPLPAPPPEGVVTCDGGARTRQPSRPRAAEPGLRRAGTARRDRRRAAGAAGRAEDAGGAVLGPQGSGEPGVPRRVRRIGK